MNWGKHSVAITVSALWTSVAWAQDMPRYDVASFCRQVAGAGGGVSASLFNSCMEMEQDAYDKRKRQWSQIPGSVRRYCNQVAGFGAGGSYSMLDSCISMELEAAGRTPAFRY